MTKIDRKYQKVFGSALPANNHIAEFGSLKAGSVAYSLDPDAIQNSAYLNGWEDALQSNKAPPLQDLNALFFLLSRQIAYTMQAGVPEYNAATEYHVGSVVNDGTGVRYISKTSPNTGNALTSLTHWKRESTGNPLGAVIATFPNLTGAYDCLATTVADAEGFVVCGGQTIADATSPMNGATIPNINNDVFLMGNATSGTAGGANTKTISVQAAFPTNHTHWNSGYAKIHPWVSGSTFYVDIDQISTVSWLADKTVAVTGSATGDLPGAGIIYATALGGSTSTVDQAPIAIDSTGSNDIRPKYITAKFVMRVK